MRRARDKCGVCVRGVGGSGCNVYVFHSGRGGGERLGFGIYQSSRNRVSLGCCGMGG